MSDSQAKGVGGIEVARQRRVVGGCVEQQARSEPVCGSDSQRHQLRPRQGLPGTERTIRVIFDQSGLVCGGDVVVGVQGSRVVVAQIPERRHQALLHREIQGFHQHLGILGAQAWLVRAEDRAASTLVPRDGSLLIQRDDGRAVGVCARDVGERVHGGRRRGRHEEVLRRRDGGR